MENKNNNFSNKKNPSGSDLTAKYKEEMMRQYRESKRNEAAPAMPPQTAPSPVQSAPAPAPAVTASAPVPVIPVPAATAPAPAPAPVIIQREAVLEPIPQEPAVTTPVPENMIPPMPQIPITVTGEVISQNETAPAAPQPRQQLKPQQPKPQQPKPRQQQPQSRLQQPQHQKPRSQQPKPVIITPPVNSVPVPKTEAAPVVPQPVRQEITGIDIYPVIPAPKETQGCKFPSANDILNAETGVLPGAQAGVPDCSKEGVKYFEGDNIHMQGNYETVKPQLNALSAGMAARDDMEGNAVPYSMNNSNIDYKQLEDGKNVGYLVVEVTSANSAIPVKNATVIVTMRDGNGNNLINMLVTGINGATETIPLKSVPESLSESPQTRTAPYVTYQVNVYADGYYSVTEVDVPIFSTIKSIQPISLIPVAEFNGI